LSKSNDRYDVQVNWQTAVPLGDTLAVSANDGFDDRWVKAFEVVLDEHVRRVAHPEWGRIDFDHVSDENGARFIVYVKKIAPQATAAELRRTLDHVVGNANRVAMVGTHVYELARELREAQNATARESAPPPPVEAPA
jgi:hypothetical protein